MKYAFALISPILLAGLIGISQDDDSDGSQKTPSLFVAADRCTACHNKLTAPTGTDVSVGTDWRPGMMANAARDPYWQSAVRSETLDHPAAASDIENECAICHIPMASFEYKAAGLKTGVFENLANDRRATHTGKLAIDGVSCTVCHQIANQGLGLKDSYSGRFTLDSQVALGQRILFGSYDIDENRTKVMRASSGFVCRKTSHLANAELCAVCHTLYTHALDENGTDLGEFPEQVPFLEWKHSSYSPGNTCQSCHMPRIKDTPIASILGQKRDFLAQHVFQAGNFFLPAIFDTYRDQLGVEAPSNELAAASEKNSEYLKSSAARVSISNVQISSEKLTAEVSIGNLAGHKLPTGYPSRRVWIHFTAKDLKGETIFESGAVQPDGSIKGNDNDIDAARYEPHYREIDSPDKAQIYEAIMTDSGGSVTTGLLKGVRYCKDNRLLPTGFDKAKADADIAVRGTALDDGDFSAGEDRIRYFVNIRPDAGPFTVEVELLYQPIAYRWAQNLRAKKGIETDRFVSMFSSMAHISAIVLARASENQGRPTRSPIIKVLLQKRPLPEK
jgi:hypothetical protein